MKLFYAEEAVADLQRLRGFIAQKNPSAAARIANELIARVENISLFPKMGIEVAEAPSTGAIRDMMSGNFVIRYVVQTESIVVLRVWHHLENHRES